MTEIADIQYARRPSQGYFLGLDKGGLVSVGIAAALMFAGTQTLGLIGLLLSLPIGAPIAINGIRKLHGTSRNTHLLRKQLFRMRQATGQTTYRKTTQVIEKGVVELPGLKKPLNVWETSDGSAVIWNPATATATIYCLVATPGMGADGDTVLSDEQIDGLATGWMVVCGAWTRRRQICNVLTLERTRPGTVVREVAELDKIDTTGLEQVAASYRQALDLAGEESVLRPTVIAISMSAASAVGRSLVKAQGGGKRGVMAMAEQEIASTTESLKSAGFSRVAWWTPREWSAWGRGIVDPGSEPSIDLRVGGEFEGIAPEVAGPMAFDEYEDHSRTDSAYHRAYWVMEWPRLRTMPGFMSEVVKANNHDGLPVRHVYCQLGKPVPIEKALSEVTDERKKWSSNSKLRHKRGDGDTKADEADWDNLDNHEEDLISGQGELKATGYVLVTGLTEEALNSACASMEVASSNAGIELLNMVHQQGAPLMTLAYPGSMGIG